MVAKMSYLLFLAVIAAERLNELRISRKNTCAALSAGAKEFGRQQYPWMVALHTGLLISSAVEAVVARRPFFPSVTIPAFLATLSAQALRYWVIRTLGPRWTTRVIVSDAIPVTKGPYRWLRHPNYAAVIVETAAIPLVGSCVVTAVAFSIANGLLLSRRIAVEEKALGEQWERRFNNVPRLIPGAPS